MTRLAKDYEIFEDVRVSDLNTIYSTKDSNWNDMVHFETVLGPIVTTLLADFVALPSSVPRHCPSLP
ncbi:hypothetical protein LT974_09080 [Halobacterium noricense]|nr:hypothetical protein [Halobacterium noricense]UHH24145.1 hypothetical protein LT974_09080 [Halobacterium noricense]